MTGVTTGQRAFITATDADDVELYGTTTNALNLQEIDDLFHNTTGHAHDGVGEGAPVGSAGIAALAVGTGSLADSAVTTVKIAANAVSQIQRALGSASDPTTTSTTYVDLTDMSVTLTTAGGDVEVIVCCSMTNSGGGNVLFLALSLDAAAEVAGVQANAPGAAQGGVLFTVFLFTGLAAGSHTIKARWKTSGGTATAVSSQRYMTVKEFKR